jgi:hypothetical protein
MKGKAMITIYSEDGITVTQRFRKPPKLHWIKDGPNEGRFVPANLDAGYFPLIEVERPSLDHARSVVRFGDAFTEAWTFDQELADRRIQAAAEQAERERVARRIGGTVQALKRMNQDVGEMSNAEQTEAIRQLAAAAVHLVEELTPNMSDMNQES